uniref:Uncharacterized protein n=1 Tax=Siphoviridae sp. ct8aS59 TaxID=2825365 RepID=A0A8S5TSY3_9CAUD|nr:MAG TPA: hypothetical protein [Siphoviridae sp. ct8aS59]
MSFLALCRDSHSGKNKAPQWCRADFEKCSFKLVFLCRRVVCRFSLERSFKLGCSASAGLFYSVLLSLHFLPSYIMSAGLKSSKIKQ